MQLPKLYAQDTSREVTTVFGGYNHNPRGTESDWYEQKNMSSEKYPLLSSRPRRWKILQAERPQGMIAKDALAYIDGSRLVYNGLPHDLGLSVDERPKQLLSMGAYILIWPDAKYFNTQDLTDYGSLGAKYTSSGTVTFCMTDESGTAYEGVERSDTEPKDPQAGALWLDTSQTPPSLKEWSGAQSMWVSVAGTYIRIEAGGIGAAFSQYDGVHISGLTAEGTQDINNVTSVIWQRDTDWITVAGLLPQEVTQTDTITVERRIPDMEYLTESGNRIWGCHYGMVGDKMVNEIYACKQGDPKNWYCYMGVSTDSYAVGVGTDGVFTGAVTYLGLPTFFKENAIHRISGSYPASYQMHTTDNCRGVQRGSERSLVVVNERLYYKAVGGVMMYDGSLPQSISYALGGAHYTNARAGELRDRYHITMQDSAGKWRTFVWDTGNELWEAEDDIQVLQYCRCREDLYFFDAAGTLWSLAGVWTNGTPEREAAVEWEAVSGAFGYADPDQKYVGRMDIRLQLERGARCEVAICYDDIPAWEHKVTLTGERTCSRSLPIRPRRCDHFRIRLRGRGDCCVYSIARIMEHGGEP